jgi:hypothetical protein
MVEGAVLAAREDSDAEVCREKLGEDGGIDCQLRRARVSVRIEVVMALGLVWVWMWLGGVKYGGR